jgi:CspA family cold shock protein
MEGTVKMKDDTKGFGFITESESGKDYFFHKTDLSIDMGDLNRGDTVTFEVEQTKD